MAKIKKLPAFEARKIAAGEVVERPANIVKELIENSIDALADQITVYIEQGGKKLIRVIDNGFGMSPEDALLSFEHHATSKINSVDDLNTLNTFGFRGEALSSISSISKVTLTTKEKIADQGYNLILSQGQINQESFISASNGTDFQIEDIFFNIPARLKFLKKEETELRSIIQIFQAFCLSYPAIHFKLFHENSLIYNCPSVNDLLSRTAQLWDHNLVNNMLECSTRQESIDLAIYGAISNHQLLRYNKQQIFFFINGRWIKNSTLTKAFIKGYNNVLPQDKFPAGFIFLKIDPSFIDVNVHPRKEEVQFLHPKKVESLITDLVKKTLEKNLSNQISFNKQAQTVKSNFFAATPTTFDFEPLNSFEPLEQSQNFLPLDQLNEQIIQTNNISSSTSLETVFSKQEQQASIQTSKEVDIIGQFNNCYILIQQNDGLFLIDQHAAHERILYETFTNRFENLAKIQLMFPVTINISEQNLNLLENYLDILRKYAIDIERFAVDQLIIYSSPVHLKDVSLNELILQLISWIEENNGLNQNELFKVLNNKLCAQMACKAAVKSGDVLNMQQMKQLLDDLERSENKLTCPHGRPTGWLLPLYEIEKRFKRKL